MFLKVKYLIISALVSICSALHANDSGLYPAVVDPNSGFVRVAMATPSTVWISGKRIDLDTNLSGYVTLPAGRQTITWQGGDIDVALAAGAHETVIVAASGAAYVAQAKPQRTAAKADLTVINLSPLSEVSLYVPLAQAFVLEDIAPATAQTIALRAPLTLDFEAHHDGARIAEVAQVSLQRKSGVTFVLTGTAPRLIAVPDSYVD